MKVPKFEAATAARPVRLVGNTTKSLVQLGDALTSNVNLAGNCAPRSEDGAFPILPPASNDIPQSRFRAPEEGVGVGCGVGLGVGVRRRRASGTCATCEERNPTSAPQSTAPACRTRWLPEASAARTAIAFRCSNWCR